MFLASSKKQPAPRVEDLFRNLMQRISQRVLVDTDYADSLAGKVRKVVDELHGLLLLTLAVKNCIALP